MSNLINKIAKQISVAKKEVNSNLKKYINEIIVIKYGGSAMSDKKLSLNFFQNIKAIVDLGIKPIIVHGGGPQINLMLDKVNIKHKFFKGMRITDKKTFDIVEMVLSGVINKNISYYLSNMKVNALGLSGVDSKIIVAKKYRKKKISDPDLGLVGKPYSINKNLLLNLVSNKTVPVIAPIGANSKGTKFNINAD